MKENNHYLNGLLDYLKLNPNKFAKSIGVKHPTMIYNMLKRGSNVSPELAKLIVEKYPRVSRQWLLTGKGEMLTAKEIVVKPATSISSETKKGILKRIKQYMGYHGMDVRAFEKRAGVKFGFFHGANGPLKTDEIRLIASCFYDLNSEWLLTGEGDMLDLTYIDPQKEKDSHVPTEEMKEDKHILYEFVKGLLEERQRTDKQWEIMMRVHSLLVEKQLEVFSKITETQMEILAVIKQEKQLLLEKTERGAM